MKRILVSLLCASAMASASAENWSVIATDNENTNNPGTYMVGSVTNDYDVKKVWVDYHREVPVKIKKNLYQTHLYMLFGFKCSEKKATMLAFSSKFSDGSEKYKQNPKPYKSYQYITPDSIEEKVYEYACSE